MSQTPAVSTASSGLSPQQEQVLALLSAGSTTSAAAEAAGVHRNTIAYWRRTSLRFSEALTDAQSEKARLWRERAEELAASAVDALKSILTDPKTAAGVRLKAALTILKQAATPPPPEPDPLLDPLKLMRDLRQPAPPPEIVHKNAQTNPAPAPIPTHKIGRNEPCPCASGKKFKHCCLNQARANPRAAGQ